MSQASVIKLILRERKRQDEKWGEQNNEPLRWMAILSEEVGETNKAILENNIVDYVEELIQVAAVAVAALEAVHQGGKT
ncbi:MAG: hypothetical protein H8E10_16885 [Desulfobacterales bacterium]|nr:hypothetical protein [Desulfobacterales bacterium]